MEKVIIIGSGPAGLAAAIYNARAFLRPLVIGGSPPGGQLTLTTEVENYPGFESIQGPELVSTMRKHAEKFETRFVDDNVSSVDFSNPDELKINLTGGDTYATRAILIASGASAKWLDIESEKRLMGKGVSACATCDGFFFKDKIVGVVGGGDAAMEEALTLTKFAKKIYLLHRRNQLRASQIMQKRVIDHEKIEVLWGTEVEEILGSDSVESVKIKFSTDRSQGNPAIEGDILNLDGLFVAIGHTPNTDFLKGSGLVLDKKGYVVTSGMYAWESKKNENVDERLAEGDPSKLDYQFQYATNIKGVFAAGDVVDHVYRQAITAAGMSVSAALEVENYLYSLPSLE